MRVVTFNSSLNLEDSSSGSSNVTIGMQEFNDCVDKIEVMDINSSGMHYTWNQKPKRGTGLLKKIDRVMGNLKFIDVFPAAYALFQPYRISDHSPCVLKLPSIARAKPKPFKFPNFLIHKDGFMEAVKTEWETELAGHFMFRVTQKLKAIKKPMRKMLHNVGNLHARVEVLRAELDAAQISIDQDPSDPLLREKEAVCLKEFHQARLDEERFLKQKAKIEWLEAGDTNSAFFHRSLKCKNHRNRIEVIKDMNGVLHEGGDAPLAFVNHYQHFIGREDSNSLAVPYDIFRKTLSQSRANSMVRAVSDEEIRIAMFAIGEDKAPGPDGYTSAFFKGAWDVVGPEICLAVHEFFRNGKLLQQLNHTIIALIPKVTTPSNINDYRPILCCNTLYKCICKIITNRIKEGLHELVSVNQSAFVPGRRISDNILLTQELMHNYHRDLGPPRCAFKIDIQKAYDTVDWMFLREVLVGFGFHHKMISWIMTCVTTTSFSLSINGNLHGYFKGKKGLRQGDPMSPYLFTLVMEVLTLLLDKNVLLASQFRFHHKCDRNRITNLCFADDLFIFSRGEARSAKVIMDSLTSFSNMSGLKPSLPKSTVYFCNVPNHLKQSILNIMPFEEGSLPVKYLGVPLILSRLAHNDCKVLVERMEKRVTDWRNKSLSFAGRLQLIQSVLASLYIYWASVFILPQRILDELERKMRNFLWSQGEYVKGKAKVSWDLICRPKIEGGLGIKRISDVNKALMTTHIWSILDHRESLWVKWIHSYRLANRSFWDVPVPSNCSWGWRKLLQLRDQVRPYLWSKIGNGRNTMIWFDTWHEICPIRNIVSNRDIRNAGFSLHMKVCDLVLNGNWNWPDEWLDVYPALHELPNVNIRPNVPDSICWKNEDGNEVEFSSYVVWNTIRHRHQLVPWGNVVWFKQMIPRHSFIMWLIFLRRLNTQDRMMKWNTGGNMNLHLVCCSLCKQGPDSHNHLFFECSYSSQVWNTVRHLAYMHNIQAKWDDVAEWMILKGKSNSARTLIGKLLVAATAYFIWQERNMRLFSNKSRPVEKLSDIIASAVRLKLVTMRFKNTRLVNRVVEDWNIPRHLVIYDS